MRFLLRSALAASFALSLTWGLSGCDDSSKTTPPVATPTTEPKDKMEPGASTDKMEPAATTDKMEPTTPPPAEKPKEEPPK